MTKTLKEVVNKKLFNTGERYYPGIPGERKFFDAHKSVVFKNMYSDSKFDPLFRGSTKPVEREKEAHGYSLGKDAQVHDKVDSTRPLDSAINDGTAQRVQSTAGTDAEYASYQPKGDLTEDSDAKQYYSDLAHQQHDRSKFQFTKPETWSKKNRENAKKKSKENFAKANSVKEDSIETVTLIEAKKFSAHTLIHHDGHAKSAAFADEYHKGHKIDHCTTNDNKMWQRHSKNNELFHTKYHEKYVSDHDSGPFNAIKTYTHHKTGDTFQVHKVPNGKGFSGTDHIIHYLGKSED